MGVHLDPAQRQQRIDQPRHARGLLGHDRQEALARAGIALGAALQRLDEAAQRGQRRAELVAGIGDEIGAHLVDALDLGQVAQQHQDAAAPLAAARQRRDRRRHAPADRNALGVGDRDGAPALGRGRHRVEEFRRSDHRGNVAPFAQRGEQAARRRIAEQHMARRVEHDHRVRQGLGHRVHGRGRARRGRRALERPGESLIGILAGQQHHRDHEADQADQGEGLGQTGDQHQRRHDDGDSDDQPQGRPEPCRDLPEGPHDGLADAREQARLKGPGARFCLIAQCLLSAAAQRIVQRLAAHDCPWIITFLRQA